MFNLDPTERGMIVHAFIPQETVKEIDRIAKYEGISRSAYIRRAAMKEIRKDRENNPGNAAKLNPGQVTSQPEESNLNEDSTN